MSLRQDLWEYLKKEMSKTLSTKKFCSRSLFGLLPVRHPSKEEVSEDGAHPEQRIAHPRDPILVAEEGKLKIS